MPAHVTDVTVWVPWMLRFPTTLLGSLVVSSIRAFALIARVIVQLDALAAAVLGEPEILPPPAKMPPPPPDPQEPLWERIWALIGPEPKDG